MHPCSRHPTGAHRRSQRSTPSSEIVAAGNRQARRRRYQPPRSDDRRGPRAGARADCAGQGGDRKTGCARSSGETPTRRRRRAARHRRSSAQPKKRRKGDAATTIERGKAEAQALHQVVEAYRQGGAASREVLALQNLLPLLSHVSGAHHSLTISKVSVLPSANTAGSEMARKAIGASEQIRAATGVDLAGVARKLGG